MATWRVAIRAQNFWCNIFKTKIREKRTICGCVDLSQKVSYSQRLYHDTCGVLLQWVHTNVTTGLFNLRIQIQVWLVWLGRLGCQANRTISAEVVWQGPPAGARKENGSCFYSPNPGVRCSAWRSWHTYLQWMLTWSWHKSDTAGEYVDMWKPVLGQNPTGQKPIGQYPSGQNPRRTKTQGDKIPWGQKPRGTISKWDKSPGGQKPRGTKSHGDKNPWRTISKRTISQGDKIPRCSQEWCICVLRPEKYMTIGPCLVMLRHPPTPTPTPHPHIL